MFFHIDNLWYIENPIEEEYKYWSILILPNGSGTDDLVVVKVE